MDFLINEFHYDLPSERISQFPLAERDQSKLLLYKDCRISHDIFRNLADHLPERGLLIVNNTRVIHARLVFIKPTGAHIEVFCLHPVEPSREIQSAFSHTGSVGWNCLVGNAKRWKQDSLAASTMHAGQPIQLVAERVESMSNPGLVRFHWTPAHLTFAEALDAFGKIPLPPYIHREPQSVDEIRYQTMFASMDGSVAAPTAGLHFTGHVFDQLRNKQTAVDEVTLHVGAGTFIPVTTSRVDQHVMHTEFISVSFGLIERICQGNYSILTAVGTTTMRTLESLYWYGVRLIRGAQPETPFFVSQWEPYQQPTAGLPSAKDSLEAILELMGEKGMSSLTGLTQLMIVPGYRFRLPGILITNFHQPQSTLLLLVAAFIGNDWKKAYQYALDHEFRFLSYGESCLFYKNKSFA